MIVSPPHILLCEVHVYGSHINAGVLLRFLLNLRNDGCRLWHIIGTTNLRLEKKIKKKKKKKERKKIKLKFETTPAN